MDYPGFIYGSYESQAWSEDAEDCINLYVERMESQGATSRAALYPTPGVATLGTAVSGVGRAHLNAGGREYAVIGGTFYTVTLSGTVGAVGSVAQDANPATISYNGDGGGQLFITSGSNGYVYDISTGTLTQVTALNGAATMGAHLDGYFLALNAGTSTFYISNLLDGLVWNTGVDFAQRSQSPDPWVSMKVNPPYVWLLGSETTDVWFNNAQSFPFAPHPSGRIAYGCAAPFSVAQVGSSLTWLGTSVSGGYAVLQAQGFAPEVVSSIPQQLAMSRYTTVEDAVADSYTDIGHTFYVLNFPTEDVTWAWDSGTGLWAKRGTWISEDGEFVDWRPRFHAQVYGEHRWLDSGGPKVYRSSSDLYTDVDDRPIRRLRRAPCLLAEDQRVFFSSFELDMETGNGIEIGTNHIPGPPAGSDNSLTSSQVMMRYSNDGGKNWSPEIWRAIGKVGAYGYRVIWRRLGMGRRRVFEVSFTSPVACRITNAYLALGQSPVRQGAGMAS